MKKYFVLIGICLSISAFAFGENKVIAYSAPNGVEMNNDFTVEVSTPDGKWQRIPTYMVLVDEVVEAKHHYEKSSLAYFDFEGEAKVRIVSLRANVKTARIRPLSYGITPVIDKDTLLFTLDRPRNLSVEVNGDIFHNLQLFANPIDKNAPKKKKAKNLIYFGAGFHQLSGDTLNVPSGTTVYIAGGAVVKGTLQVHNANNVKIFGRGIIRPERGAGVHIKKSTNIEVEGIITSQCPTGESNGVTIRNVKSISHYGWGDGMNVFASSNVLFDGVFCRNSDDCTTVYATRLGHKGSCRHIKMQNSTLWADVAHPIFIGLHGSPENHDVIEDVVYENIDILDHKEKQIDYQGCMAINAGDNNFVRNIRFENIRIENFRQGQLVDIRISFNKKYCTAPGLGIENVLFKDITYTGDNAEISIIAGYDETRKIKNVRFENLKINGVVISDDMPGKPAWYKTSDMARFFIGEHTENITFVP